MGAKSGVSFKKFSTGDYSRPKVPKEVQFFFFFWEVPATNYCLPHSFGFMETLV
jgi:hypothetical protein